MLLFSRRLLTVSELLLVWYGTFENLETVITKICGKLVRVTCTTIGPVSAKRKQTTQIL